MWSVVFGVARKRQQRIQVYNVISIILVFIEYFTFVVYTYIWTELDIIFGLFDLKVAEVIA